MIISFVNPKGGVDKSTLTLTTATSRAVVDRFKSPCMIELDPQGTLKSWFNERQNKKNNFTFYQLLETDINILAEELEKIRQKHDIIFIDTLGESTAKTITQFILAVSNKIIIPIRTSINDEQSFEQHLLPFIEHMFIQTDTQPYKFFILPIRVLPQTKAENVIGYFKSIMPEFIKCLPVVFRTRNIFENFGREGLTLNEYAKSVETKKKDSEQVEKAILNVEEIANTIINI